MSEGQKSKTFSKDLCQCYFCIFSHSMQLVFAGFRGVSHFWALFKVYIYWIFLFFLSPFTDFTSYPFLHTFSEFYSYLHAFQHLSTSYIPFLHTLHTCGFSLSKCYLFLHTWELFLHTWGLCLRTWELFLQNWE